jgi:hypothetical protein
MNGVEAREREREREGFLHHDHTPPTRLHGVVIHKIVIETVYGRCNKTYHEHDDFSNFRDEAILFVSAPGLSDLQPAVLSV